MARRNFDYLNPNNYWAHADPRHCSKVWIDNNVYADLNNELEYYRLHPTKADVKNLLNLIRRMTEAWQGERNAFKRMQKDFIKEYNVLVDSANSKTDEIKRLNDVILQLDNQVQEQAREQQRINEQINQLIEDKNHTTELARRYINEAIDAYNKIANDSYYSKFVPAQLQALQYLFEKINNLNLDSAAVQGLAVDALSKIYAMNKEVIRKRVEFDIAYEVVWADAQQLCQQYDVWQNDVYFDIESRRNQVDMAYWSRGLFPQQRDSLDEICHELEGAQQNPHIDTDKLWEIQQQLELLRKYGEETVNEVLARSRQSEKAEALGNIASLILVEEFHFKVVFVGFNDNDERSAYITQLHNASSGIDMQLVFTPLDSVQIGCTCQVSFEGYQDGKRANDILNAVWYELRPNKITPSGYEDSAEPKIVDHIDFATFGQPVHLEHTVSQNS